MSKANKSVPQKKGSRFIPFLFIVGILGWFLFIMDRLNLPNSNEVSSLKYKEVLNVSSQKQNFAQENSFWEDTKGFLQKLLNKKREVYRDTKEQKYVDKKTKLANINNRLLSKEKNLSTSEERMEDDLMVASYLSQGINEQAEDVKLFPIYLYHEKKGDLQQTNRQFHQVTLKGLLKHIIEGPNISEKIDGYVDTFPNKPRLLNVSIKKDIAYLNFDENFIRGISFQILKIQLKQLLLTSVQFSHINAIKIQMYNEDVIEVDGIEIPERIDANTWPIKAIF